MAQNFYVFPHGSNPSIDRPKCFVNRDRRDYLIATGFATMISARAVQLCKGARSEDKDRKAELRERAYVPPKARRYRGPRYEGKLPPLEVAGCKFQEPQSATWNEQHFAHGARLRYFQNPVRFEA